MTIAEKEGVPLFESWARVAKGWALAIWGRRRGVAQIREGLAMAFRDRRGNVAAHKSWPAGRGMRESGPHRRGSQVLDGSSGLSAGER